MKKVEAIIPTEKIDIVYNALKRYGIDNIFITTGQSRGFFHDFVLISGRGTKASRIELIPSAKIEFLAKARDIEIILRVISKYAGIGATKGMIGKVMILDVTDVRELEKDIGTEAITDEDLVKRESTVDQEKY